MTEALTAGLPVLAAPFSTDQFAGAEDLRRAGLGNVIDPTIATRDEIAARLGSLLGGDAPRRAAALGGELRRAPVRSSPRTSSKRQPLRLWQPSAQKRSAAGCILGVLCRVIGKALVLR